MNASSQALRRRWQYLRRQGADRPRRGLLIGLRSISHTGVTSFLAPRARAVEIATSEDRGLQFLIFSLIRRRHRHRHRHEDQREEARRNGEGGRRRRGGQKASVVLLPQAPTEQTGSDRCAFRIRGSASRRGSPLRSHVRRSRVQLSSSNRVRGTKDGGGQPEKPVARAGDAFSTRNPPGGAIITWQSVQPPPSTPPAVEGGRRKDPPEKTPGGTATGIPRKACRTRGCHTRCPGVLDEMPKTMIAP